MNLRPSRRTVLKLAAAATGGTVLAAGGTSQATALVESDSYVELIRVPDAVSVATDPGGLATAAPAEEGRFAVAGVEVVTEANGGALSVRLVAPKVPVMQIRLRWRGDLSSWRQVLGDHWERSYGDLAWRPAMSVRPAPWSLLASTAGGATHGFGVKTSPAAFCFFLHDAEGITLVCDVRAGTAAVELGERVLKVCEVVSRRGEAGESSFAAQVALCKRMCDKPRLTAEPVYGFNDWYYAYGKNTPASLVADAELLGELTAGIANRPFCVIDDGWQVQTKTPKGQWSATRPSFIPMDELAAKMKAKGTRPGIWMRPLLDELDTWEPSLHLKHRGKILDPSLPGTMEIVTADIQRLAGWGYELIKHDFSTFDLLGDWGKDMQDGEVTRGNWTFARRDRTTAEVIGDLYATIRKAAGEKAIVIGCNTVSHLSAGVFEGNRIGDDTSGREWGRVVQMGVNTLAFRAAQQGTFYGADPDCAAITEKLEWRRARQWLDLVARSGTPLFVSLDRKVANAEILGELKSALAMAAKPLPVGEPLDWKETAHPAKWKLEGQEGTYDWS